MFVNTWPGNVQPFTINFAEKVFGTDRVQDEDDNCQDLQQHFTKLINLYSDLLYFLSLMTFSLIFQTKLSLCLIELLAIYQ